MDRGRLLLASVCLISGSASAQPGLDQPQPFTAFLDGVFPSETPGRTPAAVWATRHDFPNLNFPETARIVEPPRENKLVDVSKTRPNWFFNHSAPDSQTIQAANSGKAPGDYPDLPRSYNFSISEALGPQENDTVSGDSELLVNGSFEAGFAGWTKTGNLNVYASPPYAAADGTTLVAFNGGNLTPNGILTQSFGTIAGQTYALSFAAGVLSYNKYSQTLQVTVSGAGNLLTQSITIAGLGGGTNHWQPYHYSFVANSATTTLAFQDNSIRTDSLDLLLDHVHVTAINDPDPPEPGAVTPYAHYRMGDGAPATNGGRNLPYDSSGNGRHMANAAGGTPILSISGGPGGDAFYTFSGSNQYYYGTVSPWDPPEDNVGAEAWVRTSSLTQSGTHVFGTGSNSSGINLGYDAGGGRGWYGAVAGKAFAGSVGTGNYSTGEWIHLAVVRASGTTTFYVNGAAHGSTTAVPDNAAGTGALHMTVISGGAILFQGGIAEARVFTFEPGSFDPAADLLLSAEPPQMVLETSTPTLAGKSYIARFRIQPKPGETTVPRLRLGITGTQSLKVADLRTALPAGADSVPYFFLFTADSATTALQFSTPDGDTAEASQITGLEVAEPLTPAPAAVANARQQAQIARQYGLFLHFGINTFTNLEWGLGTESPAVYQPTALDVDQWVRTASEAGMRYVLIISKHHDGFCMWDSKWTTHDIGSSPVKTDILAEAAAACRKYGIAMAVYYSLWDRHEPSYPNDPDYNLYAQRQLAELMGNYGPVCELWLDGGWDKANTRWPSREIYDLVRRLQPDCQISTNWTIGHPSNPDANFVLPADQQAGYPIRYFPSDFRLGDPYLPKNPDPKTFTHNGNTYYLPFESTITLSAANNWFFHPTDVANKTTADLAGRHAIATAQDNMLVLNAPPDRSGRVRDLERGTLFQLRDLLGLKSGLSLPYGGTARSVPGTLQAEDFDTGGQAVAYHDLTSANLGGQYRPADGVDLESTTDAGGGYRITGTEAGEWLKYTIRVAAPGAFSLNLRVANALAGGKVRVEINGNDVTGLMTIPQTGGMDTWQTISVSNIQLAAGEHLVRLVMETSAPGGTVGAINWLSFIGAAATGPTAHAGPDQLLADQDGSGFENVTLDAGASVPGPAPIASYLWSEGSVTLGSGVSATFSLAPGVHVILLRVTDDNGAQDTDEVVVTVAGAGVGLINGSFEADYQGWTRSGNQGIQSSPPYVPSDGAKLVAFNSHDLPPNGILSQSFATIPGTSYDVFFDMGVLAYNNQQQRLQVDVTGSQLLVTQTHTISRLGSALIRWQAKSLTFTADSPSTTQTLRHTSTVTIRLDLLLDNVRIIPAAPVSNTAPVAVADSYSTPANTPLAVPAPGVLANDTDAESNPLTAVIDAGPSHGTVTLGANGGFTYTPATGFAGADSFTYHASDGAAKSNTVSVGITVVVPGAEALVNGSFESSLAGWTNTGNLAIQAGAIYAPTHGTKMVAFNAGNTTPNAVLSQSFATVAGQNYTLAFDAGVLSYNTKSQTLQVLVTGPGSLLSETLTLFGPGNGTTRWQPQAFTFVAESAAATLTFRDLSTSTIALDLTLDNVRITALQGTPAAAAAAMPDPGAGLPPGSPTLARVQGVFRISMPATEPGRYQLQRSKDLQSWKPVATLQMAGPGPLQFTDPDPAADRMFYRIARDASPASRHPDPPKPETPATRERK